MGKTFAPKRGAKIRGFVVLFGRLGRRLHFCGETPTFVVKVGEGNISAFWGGNKRDGGMLLNFGIGNIRMVSFNDQYYIYIYTYVYTWIFLSCVKMCRNSPINPKGI